MLLVIAGTKFFIIQRRLHVRWQQLKGLKQGTTGITNLPLWSLTTVYTYLSSFCIIHDVFITCTALALQLALSVALKCQWRYSIIYVVALSFIPRSFCLSAVGKPPLNMR